MKREYKQIYKRKPSPQFVISVLDQYLYELYGTGQKSYDFEVRVSEYKLLLYLGTKSQYIYTEAWIDELIEDIQKRVLRNDV